MYNLPRPRIRTDTDFWRNTVEAAARLLGAPPAAGLRRLRHVRGLQRVRRLRRVLLFRVLQKGGASPLRCVLFSFDTHPVF